MFIERSDDSAHDMNVNAEGVYKAYRVYKGYGGYSAYRAQR